MQANILEKTCIETVHISLEKQINIIRDSFKKCKYMYVSVIKDLL